MRTLGKLKIMVVAAILILGMSSCLKNDDNFVIYVAPAYVLQEGSGYKLQIQIQGNEQIQSATATFDSKSYSFSAIEGSQNFLMQLNSSYVVQIDSVKGGICQVSATNAKGETTVSQLAFESTDKKIGDITLTALSYNGSTNNITAAWNKVENAEAYYLLYRNRNTSFLSEDNIWIPYTQLLVNDRENPSANATIPFGDTGEYEIAIGATYKTTLRVSDRLLRIIGGTDASIN